MTGMTEAEIEAVGEQPHAVQRRHAADDRGLHGRAVQVGAGRRRDRTARNGALVIALASAVPTMLYGWVYGVGPTDMTLIDSAATCCSAMSRPARYWAVGNSALTARRLGQRRLQIVDQVGLFPGEEVAFGLAAEMAVGGGRRIDRLVEAEVGADAARGQAAELVDAADRGFEPVVADRARAVGVDIERQRLADADRIGELDGAALGEARGDDVLGEVARGIGGRAVDLGRVLAAERAAAVRGRAAIGVDDDLAAGEAGVAVGAADLEAAGRVDVIDGVVARAARREARRRRPASHRRGARLPCSPSS